MSQQSPLVEFALSGEAEAEDEGEDEEGSDEDYSEAVIFAQNAFESTPFSPAFGLPTLFSVFPLPPPLVHRPGLSTDHPPGRKQSFGR